MINEKKNPTFWSKSTVFVVVISKFGIRTHITLYRGSDKFGSSVQKECVKDKMKVET